MKKLTIAAIVAVAALAFVGCNDKKAPAAASADTPAVTVRLLTDATGIDDKSFNAAAWRGHLAQSIRPDPGSVHPQPEAGVG